MNVYRKIIVLSILLLILSSCSKIQSNKENDSKGSLNTSILKPIEEKKETNEIMESAIIDKNIAVIPYLVDFDKIPKTVKELMEGSPSVFEGEVVSVNFFDLNTDNYTGTYTRSQIRVLKAYASDIKNGEILTVVELGGVTTRGAGERGKIMVLPNGMPVLNKGDKVLLFAEQTSFFSKVIGSTHYCIKGSYHGKFKIDGDKYENFSPIDTIELFSPIKFTQLDLEAAIKGR